MVVEEGAEGISTAFSNIVEEELSLACLNDAVVLSVAIRRGASLASLQSWESRAVKLGVNLLPETV